MAVVGESNYQQALTAAAGGRSTRREDLDDAVAVQAVLVPEPDNPYDDTAVRVDVGGRTIGYLPREVAEEYHPKLLRAPAGAWCPGRIMGGGTRSYGIHLHLGEPDELLFANSVDGLDLLDTGRSVSVTREEDHQDTLLGYDEGAFVGVTLAAAEVTRGKYQGQRCVEVRLDGHRVGELTFKMSQAYLPQVDAMIASGRVPAAEAVVSHDHRGRQLTVHLPEIER